MAEPGKDYIINEFGEIVMQNAESAKMPQQTDHEKLSQEHGQLEYEIFSHPDRFSSEELAMKKARFAELEKQLGITKKVDTLAAGKDLLKKRMAAMRANQNSSGVALNIAAHKDMDK